MSRFFIRRLLLAIPVLFFVSLIVFSLIALIPGDPARIMLGEEPSPEALAVLRREMGLDRPLYVRYLVWLSHVARGDLGRSVRDGRPVLDTLLLKLPVTVELAITSALVAWAIAVPGGVLAAWKQRLGLDYNEASFRIENKDHASEYEALMFAASNPLDTRHMVLVLAGNSPLETVRLMNSVPADTQYAVFDAGKESASGFVK